MVSKRRFVLFLFGVAAVVTITAATIIIVPLVQYRIRESELIEDVLLDTPEEFEECWAVIDRRAAALKELAKMGSVRAIPAIIELWGKPGARDGAWGKIVLEIAGKHALPALRSVLRGEVDDPTGNKHIMAITTCIGLGPVAQPLLPELMRLYRKGRYFPDLVVLAIRAIGEPESVKEVADYVVPAELTDANWSTKDCPP